MHELKELCQQLLSLNQTVEAQFQTLLQEEHSKYTEVYETIYDGKVDNVHEAFGIWTCRALGINANTNNYNDLEDVSHE